MTKSHTVAVVGVHEAKTNLSKLLRRVAAGEEIAISNRGEVVARLVAPEAPARRKPQLGLDRGKIWIADNFDEYDEELRRMFEGDDGHDDPLTW